MNRIHLFSALLGVSVMLGSSARAEIKIGVAGPITGPNAAVGGAISSGAAQAAADINASGGILGEKVSIVLGDDASDPKQGISVANRFVADGVHFVVGHYNSGVSIPASEVYAENGIFQITPGSTNPQFTERNLWNTFRVCGRDDQQGAVAGRYIAQNLKSKKLAVIDDKTPYGVGIANEVVQSANSAGVKEVIRDSINVGDKDFAALIAKLKEAKVNLVYFGGLYTEAGLLARQASDQNLGAILMAGDGITSTEYGQIAGDAAVGTLMTFAPDPRQSRSASNVVKEFRKKKFEPEAYTLYAYAALQIIKAGIEQSKSTAPDAVAAKLHDGAPISTVVGDISFDAKGDRKDEDYTMYIWKKNEKGNITYNMLESGKQQAVPK